MANRSYPAVVAALLLAILAPFTFSDTATAQAPLHAPFTAAYGNHYGDMTIGRMHTPPLEQNGVTVQYFSYARLDDHRAALGDMPQAVMVAPLVRELIATAPDLPVDNLPFTYGDLATVYSGRTPPPPGFTGGVMQVAEGFFVPADPNLQVTAGYVVPFQIWNYINRRYLFPHGWAHHFGLPITRPFDITVNGTPLIVQAFEKGVLTLDTALAYEWSVKQVGVGTDAVWVAGMQPSNTLLTVPAAATAGGAKRIEVSRERQWLAAYEGDQMIFDMPVSTGKTRFDTPPGTFNVYLKRSLQTLRGNENGESWNVPDVPYIMYYDRGFAIHGVYWHDRFGTGERLSHGCVGVTPYEAKLLFDWAPVGTPIIVR